MSRTTEFANYPPCTYMVESSQTQLSDLMYIERIVYTITSFSGDSSICPIKIPVVSTQATGLPMGSASGWGYKNRVIYMAPDYKYLITY